MTLGKHTPEIIVNQLQADLQALNPNDRERCHRMILCELVEGLHGGKVLETAVIVARSEKMARDEREKNSRRSRPEDKNRNGLILADREAGMTVGAIAKKRKMTVAAVNGVLNRAKKKSRRPT